MMDIHFVEPSEAPVPPEEVRIKEAAVQPMSDGRRMKLRLRLTPFQQPPSVDIRITNPEGDEVGSTSIIEAVVPEMELTLHVRHPDPDGSYVVHFEVSYPNRAPADHKQVAVEVGQGGT